MSFATLALVCLVALLGPILAIPRSLPVLVVLGELAVGLLLGDSGLRVLHPDDPTFSFLAQLGFALVMFVAGTHVPLREPALRGGLVPGVLRALLVGAVAVPLGIGLAALAGTGHGALYAVVIASSSAAFILPALGRGPFEDRVVQALPQIAIADAMCIVLLPLAIDPANVGRAAFGTALVVVATVLVWLVLRWFERSGRRRAVHELSEDRGLAIELRASLTILCALAALAALLQVSVLVAGFGFGLAVSAIGSPRRLAKQAFALTEGFFAPLFYVWLGASLGFGTILHDPASILLGLGLSAAAVVAHLAPIVTRQQPAVAMLGAAQLGVPVAAASTGLALGVLRPGEDAALLIGAVVTMAVAALAARRLTSQPAPTHHGAPGDASATTTQD